jgi:cysteine-rich repeat protein
VQEGAEGCDDGNVMAGDGCSATCERECLVEPCPSQACGDGAVETEECDDANSTSGDGCSSSCTIEPGFVCELSEVGSVCTPVCGDGLLAAGEECDDGINDGGHGECAPGCVLGAYCGDGVVNGPEQCDAGDVAELRSCAVCPGPSSLP